MPAALFTVLYAPPGCRRIAGGSTRAASGSAGARARGALMMSRPPHRIICQQETQS